MMRFRTSIFALSLLPGFLGAQDSTQFFEAKILPALVRYCYECHSEESGKSKGGLRVDSHQGLIQGGDTGPAIVPGKPGESLFMTAIRYTDPDFEMPPKGKLPDEVINDFERWIAMGAPDPRKDAKPVHITSGIDVEAGRNFWSYRPPVKSDIPKVNKSDWPRNEIDNYVLAKLEEKKLTPAVDVEPATLVRRIYYILTGLPPSPDEITSWANKIGDGLNQAVIRDLVEELLASPRYGERWGQHWLDVARYADSSGGDSNNIHPHAWRYRDYIIDSFNADKPFDQMIRQQLAGDLLPIANDLEWANNLVATGFLAIGQKLVGEVEDRKFFADLVDEQIDATTRAFLGITVACARCHDHKTDPIPQTDYYALAAIFRNTETHYGLMKAQARQYATLLDVTGLGLPVGADKLSAEELAQLKLEKEEAFENMEDLMSRIRSEGEKVTRANLRRSRTSRDRAETALQSYDAEGNPLSFAMGVQDRDERLDTRLLVRGELDKPGQLVRAGYLEVLSPKGRNVLPATYQGSGRRHLAEWIASSGNPLTSRVMANRIWYWMFGQGIVRSLDDFGSTGSVPSNPELLDYLALKMVEKKWSIKSMIPEIIMSRTWQQSTAFDEKNFEIDPDNQFLWRANSRRLEGEAIRDGMLHVSGKIDYQRPWISLLKPVGEGTVGQSVFEPEIRKITTNKRSVYLPKVRSVLPDTLELYDAPDASNVSGQRDTTTVPLQALHSMNSSFVREQAESFARRVAERPSQEQIGFAHVAAFGRLPTEEEREFASTFVAKFRARAKKESSDIRHSAMTAYCQALLCSAEFHIID